MRKETSNVKKEPYGTPRCKELYVGRRSVLCGSPYREDPFTEMEEPDENI